MPGRLLVVLNVVKLWLLLLVLCALLGAVGWVVGGYRLLSFFVFCALLVAVGGVVAGARRLGFFVFRARLDAGGLYWYADRAPLGLVGARELPLAEAPGLHSTVERLSALAGVAKPRLYLIADGLPRSLAA